MASIWDLPSGPTWASGTTGGTPSGGSGMPKPNAVASNNGNFWYDPNNGYGQDRDWFNTPVGQNIREQATPLAFASWGARQGIVNNDSNFNQWFQKQLPRFQQGYGLATMDNPMMSIDDYIATLPGYQQLRNEFNALSPNARGAQYSTYAPNVRWIPR
jgi:hypothetical protein